MIRIIVLTEPQAAGSTGVTVKASEDEPRFVIKNDNTGKVNRHNIACSHCLNTFIGERTEGSQHYWTL